MLVNTVDMAVSTFSVLVLSNSCMLEGVLYVTNAGIVSLVIIFRKSAVVESFQDTNVALVAWVLVTVIVSVDFYVNSVFFMFYKEAEYIKWKTEIFRQDQVK